MKFDSEAFWEYMRQISQHNQVFISEQTAPDDFEYMEYRTDDILHLIKRQGGTY